jgi:hypothetical protein
MPHSKAWAHACGSGRGPGRPADNGINSVSEKPQFKKSKMLTAYSVLPNNEQNKNESGRWGRLQSRKGNLMKASKTRRRPPKVDTERVGLMRACAGHLQDLRRAHAEAPADVRVNTRGIPKLVVPILEQSYCTSPAALCADLADPMGSELADEISWAELGEWFY